MAKKKQEVKEEPKKQTLGTISVTFAIVSLFLLPPVFGIAGFILGLIGTAKNEGSTAIIGLVLNIIFPIIGMILSFLVFASALI